MRLPNNSQTLCVIDGLRHLIDPQGDAWSWTPGEDPQRVNWSPAIIRAMMQHHGWTHKQLAAICGETHGLTRKWASDQLKIRTPHRMLIWWAIKNKSERDIILRSA
jgi:hypothetical protein